MTRCARQQQHGAGGEQRAGHRHDLRDRAVLALRPVQPQRDPRRDTEQREAQHHVDVAAAERGHAEQRHQRGEIEHRPQRIDRGREIQIDGNREQPDHGRDHERARDRPHARARRAPGRGSGDQHAEHEQADRAHHRQEHHPPRDQQVQRGRRPGDARDRELRRRPRVRPDRIGERALHRVAVDRDRPPVDQIPALGQVRSQRDHERVRVGRRAAHRGGRLLVAGRVGDRDDREPRLDRLVIGQLHVRGRSVENAARRRHRLDQIRVRRRRARQHDSDSDASKRQDDPPPTRHASDLCFPPLLETSANPPAPRPSSPKISAMMVKADTPPPPRELFASIVGAGAAEVSGPAQFTIDPSE